MQPFVTLGISLGLGLLIGLQRERTENRLGGIRTFPLISLLGTFCGFISTIHGAWVIVGGFLAVFGVLVVSNVRAQRPDVEAGQTTEMAALLTFAIGAYLALGDRSVAVVSAGVLVILLHAKAPMHQFVEKMGREDVSGIMRFVVISLVILPLLPNHAYGPYGVLNPFDVWRIVVLIVGISLAGYVAYKLLRGKMGTLLGGVIGGVVSSTATTVSYARRTRAAPDAANLAIVAILIASSVTYVRVILELSVVAPAQLGTLVLPIAAMLAWMILVAATAYFIYRERTGDIPPPGNPTELKSALVFGAIYAGVLVAVAAGKEHFGSEGLLVVAFISGLTDMDAITISMSRMVETQRVAATHGWQSILIASLSNLAFKAAAAAFLGGWRFGARLALFFGIAAAGGLLIVFFWPAQWILSTSTP